MLVRLLGIESEVLAGEYEHPFTDVEAWADKYVGYMYKNGLTNGVSDTLFGSENICTAQMYTTFVLRALGYSDTGDTADFTYNDALTFGAGKGLADTTAGDKFLRDNMVAISYFALRVAPKDGKYETLLDKLVADKAVNVTAADTILARFTAYDEFMKYQNLSADADIKGVSMDMTANIKMNMAGENMDASAKLNIKASIKDKTMIEAFLMSGEISMMGAVMPISAYYDGEFMYVKQGDEKIKMPFSYDEIFAQMDMAEIEAMNETMDMFAFIKNIVKTEVAGNIKYSLELNMEAMLATVMSSMELGELDGVADLDALNLDNIKVDYVVSPEGAMKSMDMAFAMEVEGMTMDMSASCTNISYDAVTITAPEDIDSYIDITDLMPGFETEGSAA